MSFREDLARVAARDARYTIEAYEFVFATIDHARRLRARQAPARRRGRRGRKAEAGRHITGQELSLAARDLAVELYGRLALSVLAHWGLRSTGDLGNVVYNLIAAGDLEKTETDERSDFDDVYDFQAGLRDDVALELDDDPE
jgi:uncharacterized repeat protein (TIGR04138 family)